MERRVAAEKWAKQGVLFGSLESMVAEHGELVREHLFQRAVGIDADKFSALHAACWSGGAFLYVPKGVTIDEPFRHSLSGYMTGAEGLGNLRPRTRLSVLDDGGAA